MQYLKKLLIWVIAAGAAYFILSHHFILVDSSFKLLKKSNLTLNYTIFSTKGKTNKAILSIDELREDGIGELLLEAGRITEEELESLTALIEGGQS